MTYICFRMDLFQYYMVGLSVGPLLSPVSHASLSLTQTPPYSLFREKLMFRAGTSDKPMTANDLAA